MCDSAYFTMQEASLLAKNNNATYLAQVSNSWTLSSVVPMLTGKLTSDMIHHGLPWDYAYPEMVEKHKQAWNDEIIQNDMLERNWDMHYHNNTCLYTLLYGDSKIKQTSTTCPETEIEKEGIWSEDATVGLMFGDSEESIEFNNKEFEYIKKFQKEKVTNNKFYLIAYQHLHMAIGTGQDRHDKIDLKKANQKVFDLINAWDFDEPDSLFIFFADHGNFRVVDRWMVPPHSWFTWALVKDNTQGKKINKKLISIRDFYKLIAEKVGLDYDKTYREDIEDVFSEQDRERVYFGEDGRSVIDPNRSTTASAIKATEWGEDGYPRKFLQVAYHKPLNRFVMFLYDAVTEEIKVCDWVDTELKRKLINRFSWVEPWKMGE
jgi:hypothetical protein